MLYIIIDILFKVPISTNKSSNHGIRYN
jgi:hypothetical protein